MLKFEDEVSPKPREVILPLVINNKDHAKKQNDNPDMKDAFCFHNV